MKYEIGNRIRKYREECGISQVQLAQKLGVSNSRVSNWEQGINRPDADIIAEICRALNVSPSDLLNVRLSQDEFSEHERKLIKAYRAKEDLQKAVNILLGVDKDNM
ncbi:MAG: helix-turn-helix domain-containing protein [Oscillospiraceae bacterium]|nr:helix-turn-helix domain-containing protein [Oscillospiraceae bacterium]